MPEEVSLKVDDVEYGEMPGPVGVLEGDDEDFVINDDCWSVMTDDTGGEAFDVDGS